MQHAATTLFRSVVAACSFKGGLGAAIAAQKESPVKYGSECHDIASLEILLFYHENKTNIINIIQQGSCYHLGPIEDKTRKSDLDAMTIRGNHKLSHSVLNSAALDKSISKEIYRGRELPLT